MDKPQHEFTDVRSHDLTGRIREGSLGSEPTYVMACACGVTYRNGLMWPPIGGAGVPYDREQALERAAREEHQMPNQGTGPHIEPVR